MMRDEILALDNNALDAAIAQHVMGLQVVGEAACWAPDGGWSISGLPPSDECHTVRPVYVEYCGCDRAAERRDEPDYNEEFWQYDAQKAVWGHVGHCLEVVPFYSTDATACRTAELTLPDDAQARYAIELISLVCREGGTQFVTQYQLITASPAQRCRAMLLAVITTERNSDD